MKTCSHTGPLQIRLDTPDLKLHYVRFGDLETSLVEMCNCTQRVEDRFVTLFVLLTLPGYDDCESVERV